MEASVDPQQLINLVKNPVFLILLSWLFKEIWISSKKRLTGLDNALKDNSDKLAALTIAITKLEVKLDSFEKIAEIIPKLKSDVDAAHTKLRDIGNA